MVKIVHKPKLELNSSALEIIVFTCSLASTDYTIEGNKQTDVCNELFLLKNMPSND